MRPCHSGRDRERYKLETLAGQYKELEHENRVLKQALHNANEAGDYYAWDPTEENNLETLCENVPVRISSTWLKELISEAKQESQAALAELYSADTSGVWRCPECGSQIPPECEEDE